MLSKLLPARQQATPQPENVRVVADLDAIVAEPVYVMLFKKLRKIEPVSTMDFLKFTQAYSEFLALNKKEVCEQEETVDRVHEVFSSLTKDISRKDVMNMTQMQVMQLFGVITDAVTGRIFSPDFDDDEKKKIRKTAEQMGLDPKAL